MFSKSVTINLSADAEARPVAVLVQIASKYESRIYINQQNKRINAKSIMGMMSVGFAKGNQMTIEAEGTDEKEAVEELANYVELGE